MEKHFCLTSFSTVWPVCGMGEFRLLEVFAPVYLFSHTLRSSEKDFHRFFYFWMDDMVFV